MKNYLNAPSSQMTTLAISMAVLLSTSTQATARSEYNNARFISNKPITIGSSNSTIKRYRKVNRHRNKLTAQQLHAIKKRDLEYNRNWTNFTAEQLHAIKKRDLERSKNLRTFKYKNTLTAKQLHAIKKQDLEYNRNWTNFTAEQLHAIKKRDLERSKNLRTFKYKNNLTAQQLRAIKKQDLEYNRNWTNFTAEQLHAIKKQDIEYNRNWTNLTAQQLGAVNLNILEKLDNNVQPSVANKTTSKQDTVHKRGIQSLQELNNQFTLVPNNTSNATNNANSNPLQIIAPLHDGIVAIVHNKPILRSHLQQTMQRLKNMYLSNGQKVPLYNELREQALQQLIVRELQLNMVKRFGINPSSQELQNSLVSYAKQQGFSNLLQLQKSMEAKEVGSYAQLVTALSNDLAIKKLQQAQVAQQIRITDNDINAFLTSTEGQMLNKNSYNTIHIRVPFTENNGNKNKAVETAKSIQNQLRLISATSDKAVAKIIAKAQANYPVEILGGNMGYHKADALPKGLTNTIVNLSIGQVAIVQTDLGIEVIKLVNKKVSDNLLIPQWHTRHILIAVNPYQNSERAKYKIDKIYNQLMQGRDFAHLAANYSNDPSSAGKGGDLSWVSEGNMVAEFEKVMKITPTGKFSKPFKTTYGWHILQVVDTRKFDASNDVRRKMAKEILFKREAPQIREKWLEDLQNSSYVKIIE